MEFPVSALLNYRIQRIIIIIRTIMIVLYFTSELYTMNFWPAYVCMYVMLLG